METVTITLPKVEGMLYDANQIYQTDTKRIIYSIEPKHNYPFTFSEMEQIVYDLTSKGYLYHEVTFQ